MPRSVSETGPRGGEAEGRAKGLPEKSFSPQVKAPPKSAETAKGAQEYAEAATVATVDEGVYTPGPAAPSAKVDNKKKRQAAKAKEKRAYKKREEHVRDISASLDFSRSKRAESYETDALTKLSNKYVAKDAEGKVITHAVQVPKLKTSEKQVRVEEHHLSKVIAKLAQKGATPKQIHALKQGAAAQVIKNNYELDKRGNVVHDQVQVPQIKPGQKASFEKELARVRAHTHEIKEGHKSYFFQSKVSKANEEAIQKSAEAAKPHHGILGGVPLVGGYLEHVASDPAGALYSIVAPGPTLFAKEVLHQNLTGDVEKASQAPTRGVAALNHIFGGHGAISALDDANMRASGIPIASGLPSLRENVIHGLHTGVGTGTEYLTRPGLAVEQGIGAALGKPGNLWNAILHGHKGKGVISGKDISEQLTGNPTGGLLIDFATDPTMWVGAGEIKLAEGEHVAALAARLDDADAMTVLPRNVERAILTGDATKTLDHLKELAEDAGVSIKNLGKTDKDKAAIADWKQIIAKKHEDVFTKAFKDKADNPNALGADARSKAADEVIRHANESKTEPGIRLNLQTPAGKHLTHIDVKLPKSVSESSFARVIPDATIGSKAFRKINHDDLINLRESKADREVLKAYDPQIKAALQAVKDAKSPAESAAAKDVLANLRDGLDHARNEAKRNVPTTTKRNPAEAAAQRSSRALAHNLNRVSASAGSSSVLHRMFKNMDEAMGGLSTKEREAVGAHMALYSDTGNRDILNAIAPLDDKGEKALEQMKSVNYELGKFGVESGTIDNLMRDYSYRHVLEGPDANKPREATQIEKVERARSSSKADKSRGYASTAEVSGRHHLADQLKDLAHGDLTDAEALKLADKWHEDGKVRTLQEDLVHAIQRGHHPDETELTDLDHEAIGFGQGRQRDDGQQAPDLFKDLEKTEGKLNVTDSAFKDHNFEEDPFGHMTAKEASSLKHSTALSDLGRLEKLRDAAERPETRDQLDHAVSRRQAEVESYRGGEPAVALKSDEPTKELRDFIPGNNVSQQYLGTLKDFRTAHPDQFTLLDPKLANYHRALSESVKNAYHMRWKAVDRAYGLDATDDALRTPDNRLYYDKRTGEEYIHMDPTVFKGAVSEGRVIPARLHQELKAEFLRMGENVQHDIFDDAVGGLFGKLNSMTRFSLTTYFPAYHMRNMISDSMNALLADPGVAFHPVENLKLSAGAMKGDRAAVSPLIKVPGFTNKIPTADYLFMMETYGLKSQEHIADFATAALKGELKDHSFFQKINPGKNGGLGEQALKYSARREDIVRMQTFTQALRRNGGDAADAAWHTIKYHFDYADLTHWEKKFMKNTFLFYTWYRKNIPLQFVSMIQKPGFFSALTNSYIELAEGGTPFNQNWNKLSPLLPDLSGPVPNSGLIPSYMTNTYASPVVNWNGHATAFSLGLPWADMNVVTNALENPQEGLNTLFGMMTPAARAAIELGSGKSLLTGQEYEGEEPSTWSELLAKVGVKLPTDDEGKPLLPWQTSTVLNNLLPVVGRGAGYLKPPSSVEDQGRFNTLFGGGWGTALTGVSTTMTPGEGERLDKAYIYKVYERAQAREAVSKSGRGDKQVEADLNKFDAQTQEWATANGIPKKYLRVVQGLGSKWFISKEDKKAATEQPLLGGSSTPGLTGTSGESILGGSNGDALGTEHFTPKSKEYKNGTEEALDLLPKGTQGVSASLNLPSLGGTKAPSKYGVEGALAYLHDLEGKTAAQPHKLANAVKGSSVEPTSPTAFVGKATRRHKTKEAPVGKASSVSGPWLSDKRQDVEHKAKVHGAIKHWESLKAKVAATGGVEGPLTEGQKLFAKQVAKETGMSARVIAAQALAEESGSYATEREAEGNHDWLNIGYFDSGAGAITKTPEWNSWQTAAKATSEFLKGEKFGPSSSIAEIIKSAGKSDQAQIEAIGNSNWATSGTYRESIEGTAKLITTTPPNPRLQHALKQSEATLTKLGVHPKKLEEAPATEHFTVPYKDFNHHVRRDLKAVTKSQGFTDDNSTSPITIHGQHGGTLVRAVQGSSGVASVIDKNQDPEIAARLLLLSAKTGKTIYITSAYRTPSQSESVGGFPDDPHTEARAMDIGVDGQTIDSANSISEAEYESVGLYRPFGTGQGGSAAEDNHVQLLNDGSPATGGYVEGSSAGSTPSASTGGSVAPAVPSAPAQEKLEGAQAQGNPGYHPGRTEEAAKAAKELRGHVGQFFSKGASKAIKTPEIKRPKLTTAAKLKAELDQIERGNTSAITQTTKRKPKFKV